MFAAIILKSTYLHLIKTYSHIDCDKVITYFLSSVPNQLKENIHISCMIVFATLSLYSNVSGDVCEQRRSRLHQSCADHVQPLLSCDGQWEKRVTDHRRQETNKKKKKEACFCSIIGCLMMHSPPPFQNEAILNWSVNQITRVQQWSVRVRNKSGENVEKNYSPGAADHVN